jgi:hypothetical protein
VRRAHRRSTCAWRTAPSIRTDLICDRDRQLKKAPRSAGRGTAPRRATSPDRARGQGDDLLRDIDEPTFTWVLPVSGHAPVRCKCPLSG